VVAPRDVEQRVGAPRAASVVARQVVVVVAVPTVEVQPVAARGAAASAASLSLAAEARLGLAAPPRQLVAPELECQPTDVRTEAEMTDAVAAPPARQASDARQMAAA